MKFGNEFWLILSREYISPKLFAVLFSFGAEHDGSAGNCSAKEAAQNDRLIANCHFYTVQFWGEA
jgi:hypothetical protein